jgi:hypothetical protein
MKLSYVGALAALSTAALLTACGGKAQYAVQGPIGGLTTPGLTLSNGGETISVPAGATSFSFSRQIDYGTDYEVKIVTNPEHLSCQFNAVPSGSAGHTVSISVPIVCTRNVYAVGGHFTGLFVLTPASGTVAAVPRTLTLLNGSNAGGSVVLTSPTDNTGAGDFSFSMPVADGQSYGVTIDPTSVPAGLNCTIKNATGFVTTSAITNVAVDCLPK